MSVQVMLDTLWVVLGGILVFFMNLGFGRGRNRNGSPEECGEHSFKELHRVRGIVPRVFSYSDGD